MHSIALYLELGLKHISDLAGYDHILFLVALCAVYRVEDWRRLIVLVTAFTVGHSITLALSSFEIVVIPSNIVEFLIPVTIFLTALRNVTSSAVRKIVTGMRNSMMFEGMTTISKLESASVTLWPMVKAVTRIMSRRQSSTRYTAHSATRNKIWS